MHSKGDTSGSKAAHHLRFRLSASLGKELVSALGVGAGNDIAKIPDGLVIAQ